ncbi:MAG: hypothetical protein KC561_15485, partial [Myxococcales bacterium]|nr:hypothetical protein [Myxococcales bacterium]
MKAKTSLALGFVCSLGGLSVACSGGSSGGVGCLDDGEFIQIGDTAACVYDGAIGYQCGETYQSYNHQGYTVCATEELSTGQLDSIVSLHNSNSGSNSDMGQAVPDSTTSFPGGGDASTSGPDASTGGNDLSSQAPDTTSQTTDDASTSGGEDWFFPSDDASTTTQDLANPPGGSSTLRIELTWDSDVDFDLHIFHGDLATFFEPDPYHLYYENTNPNWGDLSSSEDDPVFSNDMAEFGPETATIPLPDASSYYITVVSYLQDGETDTEATVTVWSGDDLLGSYSWAQGGEQSCEIGQV